MRVKFNYLRQAQARRARRYGALLLGLSSAILGCGDDNDGDDGEATAPRYVIATAISGDDTSTTYVKAVSSLDGQELDLKDAREFGGWADMKVAGDWVFVSDGEEPIVQRFTLDKRGRLEEAGRIGFARYGEYADLYMHTFVSSTKAYFTTDTEYVVWNPSTLEITGTIPFPELPAREGIEPFATLDRGVVIRGSKLFHAVSWTDTTNFKMSPTSQILVVDTDRDEIVDVLDVPCPDINVATEDEQGNLYFSNWVYSPGVTLINGGARACAVKIPKGRDEIDRSWTVEFDDATGGHEGANLVYAGGNTALFSLFREDRNPHDGETDLFDWLFGKNAWDFASMDLDTHEVTELPELGTQGGGFYAYQIDGRLLLLAPQDDYASTAFLQIDDDGKAKEVLHADGWSTRIYAIDPSTLR